MRHKLLYLIHWKKKLFFHYIIYPIDAVNVSNAIFVEQNSRKWTYEIRSVSFKIIYLYPPLGYPWKKSQMYHTILGTIRVNQLKNEILISVGHFILFHYLQANLYGGLKCDNIWKIIKLGSNDILKKILTIKPISWQD